MKRLYRNTMLLILLSVISAAFYLIQITLFHDLKDTMFYLLQDIAFLPLQVGLVTVVLNRFISDREKAERLKKMNMAVSAFFGEAGNILILSMNQFRLEPADACVALDLHTEWGDKDFRSAEKRLSAHRFSMDSRRGDLEELKSALTGKRILLLNMLQNSALMEHDAFTDMLWAVFHLMDELVSRDSLTDLPEMDLDHLTVDIERAYRTLLTEWIRYLSHLKTDYPYLFSLAVRKNPFRENADVVIRPS